jgi:hypothetical protein
MEYKWGGCTEIHRVSFQRAFFRVDIGCRHRRKYCIGKCLTGVWHEIFNFDFFMNQFLADATVITLSTQLEIPSGVTSAGIFKQSMGARNRVGIELSYGSARLHSLAELVPWNQFLGFLKVKKCWLRPSLLLYVSLSLYVSKCYRVLCRSTKNTSFADD